MLVAATIVLAMVGCDRAANEAAEAPVPVTGHSLPVTYGSLDLPAVMLFTNERGSVVQIGSRAPGLWLADGGAIRPSPFEWCDADGFACIYGYDDRIHPIIVGDLPIGTARPFPKLGVSVVRSVRGDEPCDTYTTVPYPPSAGVWTQTVVHCPGIGVVQLRAEERGALRLGLDLKSAKGLLPDAAAWTGPAS